MGNTTTVQYLGETQTVAIKPNTSNFNPTTSATPHTTISQLSAAVPSHPTKKSNSFFQASTLSSEDQPLFTSDNFRNHMKGRGIVYGGHFVRPAWFEDTNDNIDMTNGPSLFDVTMSRVASKVGTPAQSVYSSRMTSAASSRATSRQSSIRQQRSAHRHVRKYRAPPPPLQGQYASRRRPSQVTLAGSYSSGSGQEKLAKKKRKAPAPPPLPTIVGSFHNIATAGTGDKAEEKATFKIPPEDLQVGSSDGFCDADKQPGEPLYSCIDKSKVTSAETEMKIPTSDNPPSVQEPYNTPPATPLADSDTGEANITYCIEPYCDQQPKFHPPTPPPEDLPPPPSPQLSPGSDASWSDAHWPPPPPPLPPILLSSSTPAVSAVSTAQETGESCGTSPEPTPPPVPNKGFQFPSTDQTPASTSHTATLVHPCINEQLKNEIIKAANERAMRGPIDMKEKSQMTSHHVFAAQLLKAFEEREKRRQHGTLRFRELSESRLYKAKIPDYDLSSDSGTPRDKVEEMLEIAHHQGKIKDENIQMKSEKRQSIKVEVHEWTPEQDLESSEEDNEPLTSRGGGDFYSYSRKMNMDMLQGKDSHYKKHKPNHKNQKIAGNMTKIRKSVKDAFGSIGKSLSKSKKKFHEMTKNEDGWDIFRTEKYDVPTDEPISIKAIEKHPAYAYHSKTDQLMLLPDFDTIIITEDGRKFLESDMMKSERMRKTLKDMKEGKGYPYLASIFNTSNMSDREKEVEDERKEQEQVEMQFLHVRNLSKKCSSEDVRQDLPQEEDIANHEPASSMTLPPPPPLFADSGAEMHGASDNEITVASSTKRPDECNAYSLDRYLHSKKKKGVRKKALSTHHASKPRHKVLLKGMDTYQKSTSNPLYSSDDEGTASNGTSDEKVIPPTRPVNDSGYPTEQSSSNASNTPSPALSPEPPTVPMGVTFTHVNPYNLFMTRGDSPASCIEPQSPELSQPASTNSASYIITPSPSMQTFYTPVPVQQLLGISPKNPSLASSDNTLQWLATSPTSSETTPNSAAALSSPVARLFTTSMPSKAGARVSGVKTLTPPEYHALMGHVLLDNSNNMGDSNLAGTVPQLSMTSVDQPNLQEQAERVNLLNCNTASTSPRRPPPIQSIPPPVDLRTSVCIIHNEDEPPVPLDDKPLIPHQKREVLLGHDVGSSKSSTVRHLLEDKLQSTVIPDEVFQQYGHEQLVAL